MDVRLSAEQEALRDSVSKAVERHGPKSVLDLDDTARAARLDASIAQAGVRDMRAAGEDGPLTTAVEPALVAEVLSRGFADTPYLGPTLAADLRRLAGAGPADGPETIAVADDLRGPVIAPDGALPSGSAAVDAAGARTALVLVPRGSGYILATAALAGPTDNPQATNGIDLTRPTVRLDTPGVTRVGGSGAITEEQLTRWTALGLTLASAELVGIMDGALALARDYVAGREQYGSPVGSYQAVQHLLAEAHTLMEGSRSTVLHAAWAVDAIAPEEALTAAAISKAYAARSAQQVVETCIQVHGGIGNTWEHLPHVFLRRALVSTDLFGGVGTSLARIQSAYQIGA